MLLVSQLCNCVRQPEASLYLFQETGNQKKKLSLPKGTIEARQCPLQRMPTDSRSGCGQVNQTHCIRVITRVDNL